MPHSLFAYFLHKKKEKNDHNGPKHESGKSRKNLKSTSSETKNTICTKRTLRYSAFPKEIDNRHLYVSISYEMTTDKSLSFPVLNAQS